MVGWIVKVRLTWKGWVGDGGEISAGMVEVGLGVAWGDVGGSIGSSS